MKSIARATICTLFLFSLATLALAETRGTPVSGKVVNDLFRQLFVDSRSAAPSPQSWDDIKIDRPAKDYIDVELVPLSPGKKTYLITGKLVPFYGAHAEMYWVYEKTTSGYRQLDELGANYSVHVLQSSHNGYRDLETTYVSGAGTVLDTCRLVFNGKKYESTCTSKKIATNDGASRRSTNSEGKTYLSADRIAIQGSAKSTGNRIVGTIPAGSIEVEGGCTHYLSPIKNPSDYISRVVFHWGYPGLDGPKGKCVSNCLPYMHLFGKIVTVQPKTPWPEDMLKNKKIGDRFSESYQLDSMNVRFDNQITFACPPKNKRKEVCEVTKFTGIITVSDGTRKETYQTIGNCGM